jgi:hypothetical protein
MGMIMQQDVHLKDEFPYKVELCESKRRMADEWLYVNVPDTGDLGERSGWIGDPHLLATLTCIPSNMHMTLSSFLSHGVDVKWQSR